MYFSKSVIAAMASLVALGLAADPLSFTSWPKEPLQAGKPVTLTWIGADADKPVTILLRQGSSGDLQDVKPITTDGKGGTFTWTPDDDIKSGNTYAFQIRQKDETNYTALLKSVAKPVADVHEAKELKDTTSESGTAAASSAATNGSPTGATDTAAVHTKPIGDATQTTQGTHTTMTSTASKALISSSTHLSASPSSSAAASSTEKLMATGTEVVEGKEPSSTGSMQTGAASLPEYSVQLVIGIAGLLAYFI
ncbi:uncharacterized protein N7500_009242 [Penicillium coprophilum]|uniref:uncharacterized protein n=1 Tax=Penicillium coprophilum TaxID=36646 RepID=UPI002383102A|nr:uncharacterized protein N7500_009242 [Penicillium coprophilum]KAJ5153803.1 hypothetical protein N7500_009242 [Penicillium coprophilum]